MPGTRSESSLGRMIGLLVAGIAVLLLVVEGTSTLPVPTGYDGTGFSIQLGAGVVLLVAIGVAWQRIRC
jgi:hypothetical protein